MCRACFCMSMHIPLAVCGVVVVLLLHCGDTAERVGRDGRHRLHSQFTAYADVDVICVCVCVSALVARVRVWAWAWVYFWKRSLVLEVVAWWLCGLCHGACVCSSCGRVGAQGRWNWWNWQRLTGSTSLALLPMKVRRKNLINEVSLVTPH